MKHLFTCLAFSLCITITSAQMNYSFNTSNTTFVEMTNGTVPLFTGNGTDPLADEGYVNYIPIGFSFQYNGYSNPYSEVAISSNGFISLSELSNSYLINNLNNGASGERPIIAPLWDDLDLSLTSNLSYSTSGNAPNRVFTVQWLNTKWGFGAAEAAVSFQIKLYETSNWIEFIYKPENGNAVAPSASIGLTANGLGNNNFLSIGVFSLTPSVSVNSESNNITAKPTSAIKYIFKPGVLPVIFEYFTISSENEIHILNWKTQQETNNNLFNVQRSYNGLQFSTIAEVTLDNKNNSNTTYGKTYTSIDKKPLQGINYYRIEQIDKDGKKSYSSIVYVKKKTNSSLSSNLYPNPVINNLQLHLFSDSEVKLNITITNITGKPLLQKDVMVSATDNYFNFNIRNFAKGIYLLNIYNPSTKKYLVQKFVKN